MKTRRITQTLFVAGSIAAGFLAGTAFENTTTPTSCTAAMDWADAAVRVAGQAWIDGTNPPTTTTTPHNNTLQPKNAGTNEQPMANS